MVFDRHPSRLFGKVTKHGLNVLTFIPLQAFKSFERVSEQDRGRRLKELKQKDEPRAPPPVEQEVSVESVPQPDHAEANTGAVHVELSPSEEASSASSSQPDTSQRPAAGGLAQPSQDAKAEASSTDPASLT